MRDAMPADIVVARLGMEAVMEVTELTRGQIRRWNYPKEKGGHDGSVPPRHHEALLAKARASSIELSIFDLRPELRR